MNREEIARKLREHMGRIRSNALMMAHAHSALDRNRFLQNLTGELKKITALVEKLDDQKD
jgi:hypothetical protein